MAIFKVKTALDSFWATLEIFVFSIQHLVTLFATMPEILNFDALLIPLMLQQSFLFHSSGTSIYLEGICA